VVGRSRRDALDPRLYFSLLLFAATVLVLWAFGLILAPFAVPIAWAMCFATVTGPLYRRLARKTGRPRLAALVMTVLVAAGVVAPLVVAGTAIAHEATALSSEAPTPDARGARAPAPAPAPAATPKSLDPWDRFLVEHDRVRQLAQAADDWLKPFDTDVKSLRDQGFKALGKPFAAGAIGVLQALVMTAFGFIVMLATLYFLYRDGHRIRALALDLSPLSVEETTQILDVLRSTAFAAVVGGIVVALVQGTLGGIAFAITGVEGPVLWGFVMAVLSLLPIGGSTFVWGPVAAYFFLEGDPWRGWFLLAWGVGVIGTSDNFLRPWLMRRTGAGEVHPLLLFFAVISGIGLFGFSGIVFGPLLVAFVLVMVSIFRDHFGKPARAKKAAAAAAAAANHPPHPP
jgi:predicted PurR-regulated permease PerM